MKPAINKLITNIRPTFAAVTSSIGTFWQKHRRIIGWAIGLTLLILLAATLFVWLWSRSRLFRNLILILAVAVITDSRRVINWLTEYARELQDTACPASSLTPKTTYDPHEEQGDEVRQDSKVESDPMPV